MFQNILWLIKPFELLSNTELYEMLRLRSEVFVVEQNCAYLDCDGKDEYAIHILGYYKYELICTARLLPEGVSYKNYCSIGRVASKANYRNKKVGKALMEKAIQEIEQRWGKSNIKIGAQAYLKHFYESFGFMDMNEPYLEDGIPHLIMVREFYDNIKA